MGNKPPIPNSMGGPMILRSEIQAALKKMKRHKAAGPDEIVTEMITSLGEYGVSKVTDIINEIYDTGEIAENLCRSIFIALPKKPRAIECVLYRTISLMSHIIKLNLRIIMEKPCIWIRPEIRIEQCGCVKDTGMRNTIFMVRMISQTAIEKQRDVYMCFIDYTKAFDRVQHDELLKMVTNLDLYRKDIYLIQNLYWDQSACIRKEITMSKYTKIKRGANQGCVFSPNLFHLYSEMILWEMENLKGFFTGEWNINNLRYADDTVLIAKSEKRAARLNGQSGWGK